MAGNIGQLMLYLIHRFDLEGPIVPKNDMDIASLPRVLPANNTHVDDAGRIEGLF